MLCFCFFRIHVSPAIRTRTHPFNREPLAERIETWPEADQLRLLYGLVELYDHTEDQAGVLRLSSGSPADVPAMPRSGSESTGSALQLNDQKAATQAREAILKQEGESGKNYVLCLAATASQDEAAKTIERLTATFGAQPDSRRMLAWHLLGSTPLPERNPKPRDYWSSAFSLESSRYDAAKAWLAYLCRSKTDDRAKQLVTRLASDPRWAGDPFRRVVASVAASVPDDAATRLLTWVRPYIERDPGGLGWLADVAAPRKLLDTTAILEEATSKKFATADDWLRLAQLRKPHDLNGGRGKVSPAAYLSAAAVLREFRDCKEFEPILDNASEKRLFVQAQLALYLSCGKPEVGARVLEKYFAERDLPKHDSAWCRRNLAMLYAVGGRRRTASGPWS